MLPHICTPHPAESNVVCSVSRTGLLLLPIRTTPVGPPDHPNCSDLDLNDMMFFIDSDDPGMIPDVFDEDPGEEIKWIVACEDLGNLDDFDFNDVVFQVLHVSGREQAYITPLAAGGTLETYLHYVDGNGTDRRFGVLPLTADDKHPWRHHPHGA